MGWQFKLAVIKPGCQTCGNERQTCCKLMKFGSMKHTDLLYKLNIHTYMHTCIHTYIHSYIHTDRHTDIGIYKLVEFALYLPTRVMNSKWMRQEHAGRIGQGPQIPLSKGHATLPFFGGHFFCTLLHHNSGIILQNRTGHNSGSLILGISTPD